MSKATDFLLGFGSMALGVILGGLNLKNPEFWPGSISLIVAGFIIIYFAEKVSEINKVKLEINELKEKLIISDRLNKLELKVFKK